MNIAKHIAATLKSLRNDRNWSLDKTAQETGVSKAMLGQIEREESSPTIATLWKIANGFQVSFSTFINDVTAKPARIVRSKPIQNLNVADDKIQVTTLFPFDKQLQCEIFRIKLLPHCKHLSLPHASAVIEHVMVIEGTMQVLLNDTWRTLRKGEGLRFDANQPHGYRNVTSKDACFHNVIHYQSPTR